MDLQLIQEWIAKTSITASSLRNQGSAGVHSVAREYLARLPLSELKGMDARGFEEFLDSHTARLTRQLPENARHWGAARKALNLFLRDALYNSYLCAAYDLQRCECFMEIPLDSQVAQALRKRRGASPLPRWPGIKHLTPQVSEEYQSRAAEIAAEYGSAKVHLDIVFWRAGVW
jgi:hypothetical protein